MAGSLLIRPHTLEYRSSPHGRARPDFVGQVFSRAQAALALGDGHRLAHSMSEDPYSILEVEHGATSSEIKAAYRRLAAIYHPDRNPGFQDAANEKLKALNDAYARINVSRVEERSDPGAVPTEDSPSSDEPVGADPDDEATDHRHAIAVELVRVGFLQVADRDHPMVEVLASIVPDAGRITMCLPCSSVVVSGDHSFKELRRSFTRISPTAGAAAFPVLGGARTVWSSGEIVLCTPDELIWTTSRITSVEGPWEQLTLIASSLAWVDVLGSRLTSRRRGTVDVWIDEGPTMTFRTTAADAGELVARVDAEVR